MRKNEKTELFRLLEIGQKWNDRINYNANCRINEKFLNNEQWDGVKADGLPKPVLNLHRNVADFKIAYLCSSPIDILFSAKFIGTDTDDEQEKEVLAIIDTLNKYVKKHWENCKMDRNLRKILYKAYISGDLAAYVFWNTLLKANNDIQGDFETEILDGTQIFFGDPNDNRVNYNNRPIQPYILIKKRELVKNVRKEAKENGTTLDNLDSIVSDDDDIEKESDRGKIELEKTSETEKCTVVIKIYQDEETKKMVYDKATRNAVIREKSPLDLSLYPVAWSNWDERQNSYHGQSPMTGTIANQVFINKSLALDMITQMNCSQPVKVYDRNRIQSISNRPGQAIGVDGEVNNAIKVLEGSGSHYQSENNRNSLMQQTRECMGANDVLMGNIKPDNTSAIIQVTTQASIPLENQKSSLYDFVEQLAYIWYDFMINKYQDAERVFITDNEDGTTHANRLNISALKDIDITIKVDVGPSSMYSQLDTRTTLDNMLGAGIINKYQYISRMPDGIVPKQSELEEEFAEELGINKDNEELYELMAQFIETLPPEQQEQMAQLQEQNPEALEDEVMKLALQTSLQTLQEQGVPVQNEEELMQLAQQVQDNRAY